MKLKPLGNRIVVEPLAEEETTKSGIVLPDTVNKEKKAEGKIIAIGSGEKITALNLSEGDKVIFGKYAGEEVKVDNIEYKILTDEESQDFLYNTQILDFSHYPTMLALEKSPNFLFCQDMRKYLAMRSLRMHRIFQTGHTVQ